MTIDPKYDSIEFGPTEIHAVLGGREKNGVKSPTEEVTIFKQHLISFAKKERVMNDFTPEQAEQIKTLIKTTSKTVH